jgi:hypothetical protein
MTAVTAADPSGGVQYYFEARTKSGAYPDGFSSGWIDVPTWRVLLGGQNVYEQFRVKARDIYGNETEWSPWAGLVYTTGPQRQ